MEKEILIKVEEGYKGKDRVKRIFFENCGSGDLVAIGAAWMHLQQLGTPGMEKVCSSAEEVLTKIRDGSNDQYLSFFCESLKQGILIEALISDINMQVRMENLQYCMIRLKNFLNDSWEKFCSDLRIRLLIESEKVCASYGTEGPSIYISEERQRWCWIIGYESDQRLCERFEANLCLRTMMQFKKKNLNQKKKKIFVDAVEKIINDFDVQPEILYLCELIKTQQCEHKYYELFLPRCNKHHCCICLFEHCRWQPEKEKLCLCETVLSPKNFCELSQMYLKIQEKLIKNKKYKINNLDQLHSIAQDFLKNQHREASPLRSHQILTHSSNQPKTFEPVAKTPEASMDPNQIPCSVCNTLYSASDLKTFCKNHTQCKACLKKDLSKCIICKKVYSSHIKEILAALV